MSTEDIKDVVREKYGQAALRAKTSDGSSCCGGSGSARGAAAIRSPRTSTTPAKSGEVPDLALKASLGCGNPTALAELKAGETVLRSRLRRRHRRAALGAPRRADGEGLRSRHDRRDARARRGEQAQERPRERRVPEGRDREHPASRQLRRRDHLELRHQPVGRQGPRDQGSVSRAEARRAIRGVRCGGPRRESRQKSERTWSCGSAAWPARSAITSTWRSSPKPASTTSASRRPVSTASRMRAAFLAGEGLDVDALAKEVEGTFISGFVRATKPAAAGVLRPDAAARSDRRWICHDGLRLKASERPCFLRPSSAPGSWASGSRAETSRSRFSRTRSPRARRSWRSFSPSGRYRERTSIRP